MKSLSLLSAAVAVLVFAGCRASTESSDGMMSGKDGSACADKKEGGCPFTAAAKKDDCCASEAKADAKKSGCCAEGTAVKAEKKSGCCMEGKSEAKAATVKDCCKGKEISAMCAACKKSGEGSCDTEKSCDDQKKCEEKAKP